VAEVAFKGKAAASKIFAASPGNQNDPIVGTMKLDHPAELQRKKSIRASLPRSLQPNTSAQSSKLSATKPQKSRFSARGTRLIHAPPDPRIFSAHTRSCDSSKPRRNVTVADQGIVKAPSSTTVSWICSPLPL
jgi:hypothetical protein